MICFQADPFTNGLIRRDSSPPQRQQKGTAYTQVYLRESKVAGLRKIFYEPYSNYWHYAREEADDILECYSSFLQLAPTLKGCSKRYERFCQKYRHHSKGAPQCHWGSRMLKRLVEKGRSKSISIRVSPAQQSLPFAFDCRLSQIPDEWQKIAVRFRRANSIRDGDRERSILQRR